MKTLLAIITAVAIPLAASQATLLVYEGFDYTPGSTLTNVGTGGTGWGAGWTSDGNNPTVGSSSLSYGSLQTSGGSAVYDAGTRQKIYRNTADLDSYYDAGETIYASMLIASADSFDYGMFFGDLSGNDGIGFNYGSTGVNGYSSAGNYGQIGSWTASNTNLLVLGIDIISDDGGEDRTANVSFWLNPSSLGGSAPTATFTTNNASIGMDPTETYFSGDNDQVVDELRIGTTYADVTPTSVIPEPATTSLIALGAIGAFWFRRRIRA